MAIKEGWRGRFFEDFEVGDVYEHPLGRTVTTTDNLWFTLLTQNTAPIHVDHCRTVARSPLQLDAYPSNVHQSDVHQCLDRSQRWPAVSTIGTENQFGSNFEEVCEPIGTDFRLESVPNLTYFLIKIG